MYIQKIKTEQNLSECFTGKKSFVGKLFISTSAGLPVEPSPPGHLDALPAKSCSGWGHLSQAHAHLVWPESELRGR